MKLAFFESNNINTIARCFLLEAVYIEACLRGRRSLLQAAERISRRYVTWIEIEQKTGLAISIDRGSSSDRRAPWGGASVVKPLEIQTESLPA